MNHDPMCPNREVMADFPSPIECGSCTFIAKIRADQTQQILSDLASGRIQGNHDDDWILNGIREHIRKDTLDKARDAITSDVRELMRLIVREFPRLNGRDGAQEALNHAIEAIDALRGES